LIIGAVLFPFWLYSWSYSKNPSSNNHGLAGLSKRLGGRSRKHRIAIVIPFVAEGPEAIPPYLELFCNAAAGSASLVDFLLIHNGVLDGYHGDKCPTNVIFISLLTMDDFSQKLLRVMDQTEDENIAVGSKDKLARILSKHIIKYPYVLVEFKPALGHIFASYLEGYSHWGYSDLDILFGDMPRAITPDELIDFDIVTYGFGDQDRLYLRGQFTFHRNEDKINQLWRSCEYLSHMDKRFADVLSGEKHLHFESAEGCYSAAILQRTDIKVKYTVKAFTDIDETDTSYSHGLYVGTGKKKDTTVLYKAGSKSDGKALARLPGTWFETKDSVYSNPSQPLQWEVGERERIPLIEKSDAKCMFWAQKQYQARLCIDDVMSTDTVFWIDGQLYKQRYERATLPGRIVTAPFFHFQEWKRYYRPTQLAGFHRSGPVSTFVLSKEGVLPIYPTEYQPEKNFIPSPLGHDIYKWHGVKGNDRQQLPSHNYCLISGPRKFPPNPPAPQCHLITSWRDKNIVEIISGAPAWTQLDIQMEVTMALTLQIQAEQAADPIIVRGLLELIAMYLNRWQGQPSVLVIHVAGATPEVMAKLRIKLGPGSDLSYYGLETCLVAAIFSSKPGTVSRRALMNMAVDAAPTRWVISGFELERGIVVSHDTAFFAHRVSRIHEGIPGSAYIVPQFGLINQENDFTLPALWKSKQAGNIQALSKLEEGSCEGGEDSEAGDDGSDIFEPLNEFWWQLTEGFVTGTDTSIDEKAIERRALALDDIQLSLIALLTESKHYNLFVMDISPILMTDNLGPGNGMLTSELAREVEEFGGKQCYNGLRLAQLAAFGYSINILAGAFALSTPATRSYAFAGVPSDSSRGASRCDGCFLFDEEHEDILEDISRDERKRPAKAVLLWDHPEDSAPLFGHT
jgi:hypothetical protein